MSLKRLAAISVMAALTASLFWHLGLIENLFSRYETRQTAQHNETSFQSWLKTDPVHARDFAALSAYLKGEGVGDVVPLWALTRADDGSFLWCKGEAFGIPPRANWPHIVPALRIVRDRVIPVLGRVEVRSVYRSVSLNTCVYGAPKSRHLSFSAIDMVALDQPDPRTTFTKLCAAWAKAGPSSGWGLGAYFDPARTTYNRDARFHVDGTGWRSWGASKKAASSGCQFVGPKPTIVE